MKVLLADDIFYKIVELDKLLSVYLNQLGSPAYDGFWLMVSEVAVWIPLYVILFYLLYKNFKLNSLIFILVFVVLGITTSDQMANLYKLGIERLRPCHDPSVEFLIRKVKMGGKFGFYSGHASNTFFLATYVSLLLKNKIKFLPYVLYFWAFIVSYSRIYLGVHFAMDVVMGALMGFLLGGFFYALVSIVFCKQKKLTLNV